MKHQLDDKNKQILEILQRDAKLSVKEIASRIQLSFTPTYERIKNMEEAGIISGYVALLNRNALGLKVVAYCSLSLKEQSKQAQMEFEAAVREVPQIVDAVTLSGQHDYLLKIVVQDIEDYNQFLVDVFSTLPHIDHFQSNIVLSEVKNDTALRIP
jgi:Lrp/AsnC family leucine-responsive transcriptional regulator